MNARIDYKTGHQEIKYIISGDHLGLRFWFIGIPSNGSLPTL